MSEPPTTRGHLTPGAGAVVTRRGAPDDVAALVRQLWLPQWSLPPGESAEQLVLGYPASNVVVEPAGVALHGPTTRASTRVLTGTGWAVGALLRPAGVLLFTDRPAQLLDGSAPLAAGPLHERVVRAMAEEDPRARHDRAVGLLLDHVRERAAAADPGLLEEGLLANRLVDLVEAGPGERTPAGLARRLHVSERTLQRLAARFVGMPPGLLLRRRRLQEAAERVRADPGLDLGALAAELGFADQSHLTREFRTVLGTTPRGYARSPRGVVPGDRGAVRPRR